MPKEEKATPVAEPSFLTDPVSEIGRHGRIAQVISHYQKQKLQPLPLLEKVSEWNQRRCQPPFSEDEVKVYIQFFLKEIFRENQNSRDAKSKQVYDVIKEDPSLYLFVDQNKIPYARIRIGNRRTNLEIDSSEFTDAARAMFYRVTKKSISEPQIKEIIGLLSMEALTSGNQHDLFHRVAHLNNTVYYDLQNNLGDIVEITSAGWKIKSSDDIPLLFKNGLSQEQVIPERGGRLIDFLQFVNIPDKDEKLLFLCTLAPRLLQDIDQAIIYIYGPAGSGKTTLLKMTKDLLDPSAGGISIPISDPKDVLPLVSQTWAFCNDNVSKISDSLSDLLCIMATGGESSARRLYTNGKVHIFSVKNPAYLTGINVEATKSDLLSRALLFKTQAVNKDREVGSELKKRFEEMKPYILGGLFDVLSDAMAIREEYEFKTEFRLTDFALWGAACSVALGFSRGVFEQALKRSMKNRSYDAIYSSNAGRILLDYLKEHRQFDGTSTELLKALKKFLTESDLYDNFEIIANSPAGLSKKLRELENSLLEVGVQIDFDYRTAEHRIIRIKTNKQWRQNNDITPANDSDSNDGVF